MTDANDPVEHPVVPPPDPAPDAVLAGARAAALDAFDEIHGAAAVSAGSAGRSSVGDLDAARRRRWSTRVPLGAAAAALAVVAAVGVFATLDADPEEEFTATGAAIGDADASADDAVTEDAGEAAEAPMDDTDTRSGLGSAGGDGALLVPQEAAKRSTYADLDELVDELSATYGEQASNGSTGGSAAPTSEAGPLPATPSWCEPVASAGVAPERALVVIRADVDGRSVLAVVYDSDAGRRVAAVDASSCSVDDDRPL